MCQTSSMVNGSPYQFISESAFLHGSNNCLQLPAHGSFTLNCRGLENRRRYQSLVGCRQRKEEVLHMKLPLTKKMKRRVDDVSGKLHAESQNGGSCRGGSSQASPASELDMMDDDVAEIDADTDDELRNYRGLVLDVAYRPINVVNWKRALCLDILEKANVLEYYDQVVYSPNRMFYIPAVLRVSGFVHSPKQKQLRLTLNRNNIFLRDKFRCQYCNSRDDLTIDHVYAVSRGGGWSWENLVTACSSCNLKKADKTLEEAHMTLMKAPKEPKVLDSINLPPNYKTFRTLHSNGGTPQEWLSYLPKPRSLFK